MEKNPLLTANNYSEIKLESQNLETSDLFGSYITEPGKKEKFEYE
jgi:hypothetical protein